MGQIKSCRGLSTTIRKRSARSTKWTWFQCLGFPRGLEEAGFMVFCFCSVSSFEPISKKANWTRPSLEFRISRLLENARIQKNLKTIKKKEEKREVGALGRLGPLGPPSLFSSFFLIVSQFFWNLAFSCNREIRNSSDGLICFFVVLSWFKTENRRNRK